MAAGKTKPLAPESEDTPTTSTPASTSDEIDTTDDDDTSENGSVEVVKKLPVKKEVAKKKTVVVVPEISELDIESGVDSDDGKEAPKKKNKKAPDIDGSNVQFGADSDNADSDETDDSEEGAADEAEDEAEDESEEDSEEYSTEEYSTEEEESERDFDGDVDGSNVVFGEVSVDNRDAVPKKSDKPKKARKVRHVHFGATPEVSNAEDQPVTDTDDHSMEEVVRDNALDILARISGGKTVNERSNNLLASLVGYFLENEHPEYSETEKRVNLRTMLGKLTNLNVIGDLSHLSRAENDTTRQAYLAGLHHLSQQENMRGAAENRGTVAVSGSRPNDDDDDDVPISIFPNIPNKVGGIHGEYFQYIDIIGRGGQGKVWKVKGVLDKQEYALKMIKLPAVSHGIIIEDDERMAKVLNEMQILAALDHPNVVRYYYCWIGNNSAIPLGIRTPAAEKEDGFDFSGYTIDTEGDSYAEVSRVNTIDTSNEAGETDIVPAPPPLDHGQVTVAGKVKSKELVRHTATPSMEIALPTHTLYIVMSLAPFALSEHLLTSVDNPYSKSAEIPQHCFCVLSSLRLLCAILNGVSYLQTKNYIHRDLKPANIFLHPSNTDTICCCPKNTNHYSPRIGDFGLATLAEIDATSARVGTSFYSPPERGIHEKIDVWALGVMCLELFTKFTSATDRGFTLQKLVDHREFPDNTLPQIKQIVKGCMEEDLEQRWSLEKLRLVCLEWKKEVEHELEGDGSDEAVWATQPGGEGA